MANYFYIDANGQKQGPINDQLLQTLAAHGVINPHTPMETDTGHKGVAGQIPSLTFSTAVPTPSVQMPSAVSPAVSTPRAIDSGTVVGTKSRKKAAWLAILLGGFGAHKFYLGSWGWGLTFIAIVLTSCFLPVGIAGYAPGLVALGEGIGFFWMSNESFAQKYPPETQSPFRW